MSDEFFGEPIFTFTVADAVEAGIAVQFNPATALEAGYLFPVILTRAAYQDAIEWTRPGDEWLQSMDARFWDVLTCARGAAQKALLTREAYNFPLMRIRNTTPSGRFSTATDPTETTLAVRVEGFDVSGAPCLMISIPGED